jgi:hypothetical protein
MDRCRLLKTGWYRVGFEEASIVLSTASLTCMLCMLLVGQTLAASRHTAVHISTKCMHTRPAAQPEHTPQCACTHLNSCFQVHMYLVPLCVAISVNFLRQRTFLTSEIESEQSPDMSISKDQVLVIGGISNSSMSTPCQHQ